MKLLNSDDAIKDLEKHLIELKDVVKSCETFIENLKITNGGELSRQRFYGAGFTDEQINKFIEIMFKE